MKKYVIIGICLLVIALGGTFALLRVKKPVATPLRASESVVRDCSVTDIGVVEAVNKHRAEVGVAPLTFNKSLDSFANQRVLDMDGTMDSHVGLQPLLDKSPYMGYQLIGEDQSINGDCYNSDARVSYFRISTKHWDSLMNPRYDEIGVGYFSKVLNINLGDR